MKFTPLTRKHISKFWSFNRRVNPHEPDVENRLRFEIFNNPSLEDKDSPGFILALDGDDKIVGQIGLNPLDFFHNGARRRGFYGCDYHLDTSHRGAGAVLALAALQQYRPYFTIGATPVSEKIWLALKARIIGDLDYFVWVRNPLAPVHVFRSLLPNVMHRRPTSGTDAADVLSHGATTFRRSQTVPEGWNDYSWNNDTLQFCRSAEFLHWRFFSGHRPYYFYVLSGAKPIRYFVGRTILSRGLKILAIVDYKVPHGDADGFRAMLQAGKAIAREGRYDIVFTASSHRFFDRLLKKERFLRIRLHLSHRIIATEEINLSVERCRDRDCVYSTFLDYDKEFLD
jgi:hypothetical protein